MEDKSSTMFNLSSSMNLTNVSFCLVLFGFSIYVLRKWMNSGVSGRTPPPGRKMLPKMKKQDFYLHQLSPYNGVENERILIAVNFNVFDVSNRGRDFYGPGKMNNDLVFLNAEKTNTLISFHCRRTIRLLCWTRCIESLS